VAKKGMSFPLSHFSYSLTSFLITVAAAIAAANLRPTKVKKTATSNATPVCLIYVVHYSFLIVILQGKRPRLSKEDVNSEDDVAIFIGEAASIPKGFTGSKDPVSSATAKVRPSSLPVSFMSLI
jgi:hypothetical protein